MDHEIIWCNAVTDILEHVMNFRLIGMYMLVTTLWAHVTFCSKRSQKHYQKPVFCYVVSIYWINWFHFYFMHWFYGSLTHTGTTSSIRSRVFWTIQPALSTNDSQESATNSSARWKHGNTFYSEIFLNTTQSFIILALSTAALLNIAFSCISLFFHSMYL